MLSPICKRHSVLPRDLWFAPRVKNSIHREESLNCNFLFVFVVNAALLSFAQELLFLNFRLGRKKVESIPGSVRGFRVSLTGCMYAKCKVFSGPLFAVNICVRFN